MKNFTERQLEIIEKSIDLIATNGIQFLTIKNIAKQMGFSEPAIYRHFKNKRAILSAIIDSFDTMSDQVLFSIFDADVSPLDKIERFITDRYTRIVAQPNLAKVMFSEEIFQNDEELALKVMKTMHQHKTKIDVFLKEAIEQKLIRADIDQKALFRLIFGSLRLLIKQWTMSGYKFDLMAEGLATWKSLKKMIEV